tara:strand:+ start:1560 stop:1709 length:150 start_codon:yes stop_codon:yes gene_type:complete
LGILLGNPVKEGRRLCGWTHDQRPASQSQGPADHWPLKQQTDDLKGQRA